MLLGSQAQVLAASTGTSTRTAVGLFHRDSGAMGTGQSQRDRPANQKEAFNNCVKSLSFKAWLNRKIYEHDSTESVEDLVNAAMQEGKIKVEYKKDDKWVEEVLDKR